MSPFSESGDSMQAVWSGFDITRVTLFSLFQSNSAEAGDALDKRLTIHAPVFQILCYFLLCCPESQAVGKIFVPLLNAQLVDFQCHILRNIRTSGAISQHHA